MITSEFADLMLGYYGTTLGEKDCRGACQWQLSARQTRHHLPSSRFASASMGATTNRGLSAAGFDGTDEDVLTYAMFPKVAAQFFKTRTEGPKDISKKSSETKAGLEPAPAGSAGNIASPGESRTYIIRPLTARNIKSP